FVSVYVDDIYVNPSNYSATSGSTVITFTKAYLNSLSVGTHTVLVNFTDGYAETTITIENKAVSTGDNIMSYMIIFAVTSLALGGVVLRKKFTRK
ncbi:MAG: LPXTG cell wall anchor domain-containing protein, partial [Bacilli bacterium]|nr:LPXTG cell wall anchor domain-containing protein [Bacilli bacterium]